MRAAFLHDDSNDIEDAVRGATEATDEVPDELDRVNRRIEELKRQFWEEVIRARYGNDGW